jgi:hypothetical protein
MPKVDLLLLLARDLRARSEEVLAKAEIMQDPDARQKMREVAVAYERLARRLEKESGADKQAPASRKAKPVTVTFPLCRKQDARFRVVALRAVGGPRAPGSHSTTPLIPPDREPGPES